MKEETTQILFRNSFSPYFGHKCVNISKLFEAFKNDPDKNIIKENRIYTRIIQRTEIHTFQEPSLMISFERRDNLHIGDTLIDECGREFTIVAFEMIHFLTEFPEWYKRITTALVQGKNYSIGEYLRKA